MQMAGHTASFTVGRQLVIYAIEREPSPGNPIATTPHHRAEVT